MCALGNPLNGARLHAFFFLQTGAAFAPQFRWKGEPRIARVLLTYDAGLDLWMGSTPYLDALGTEGFFAGIGVSADPDLQPAEELRSRVVFHPTP